MRKEIFVNEISPDFISQLWPQIVKLNSTKMNEIGSVMKICSKKITLSPVSNLPIAKINAMKFHNKFGKVNSNKFPVFGPTKPETLLSKIFYPQKFLPSR